MPFRIDKVGDEYKLYRLKQKNYVNVKFKSRMSAISAGKNYMRYRKEVPYVKGNMILNKKKM
tara:strand:- start:1168 stop:1353 length:186 start_codon:yes stop_codon:yes gene_type:complete